MIRLALSLSLFSASAKLTAATFADYTLNIVNAQISPDGYTRTASLVNGQFPGTVLFAQKGDIIRNTVVNQLTDPTMRRSTSIHWHGLFQRTTAYEDGPAFWIKPEPIGAYHSHLGSQYVDGIRGTIVIYDPNDPHKALYDVDDQSTVIQLSDWYHTPAPALVDAYFKSGAEPVPDTGLINGRGRYKGGPAAPWSVINVEKGKRYRFRVINNSAIGYFKFEIDEHMLTIIEADGVVHQPYVVKAVNIHPGERYSIVVTANQTASNYWVRAPINASGSSSTLDPSLIKAILRYKGAPASDPTTSQTSGTTLDISNLKPIESPGAPGGSAPADVVIDLSYGGVSGGKTGWQVNGSQYKSPSLPTLLKILSNNASTSSDFAASENTIILPFNKVVELHIHGSSQGFFHPWHLHGHAFDIIQNAGPVNYVNPPRKDVIPVGGGTAIIRFKTSNPECYSRPLVLALIGTSRYDHRTKVFAESNQITLYPFYIQAGLAVVFAEAPNEQRNGPTRIQPSPGWQQLCPKYAALPPDQQ
ncbi:hypothetical protein FRC08_004237 [Ceratobasidium sp. 394]|nr:hypothetical protein FRC08_004237 [Ceratobasidium sp. 394]